MIPVMKNQDSPSFKIATKTFYALTAWFTYGRLHKSVYCQKPV